MTAAQNTGSAAARQSSGDSGYRHARYAESLAEFGTPRELPRCGGWVLERAIAGSTDRDAMGCYPLLACRDWRAMRADLDTLAGSLVSIAIVSDPFGDYDESVLREGFPDLAVPFKQHYVIDLQAPTISKHHRRSIQHALAALQIEDMTGQPGFLDEWLVLHRHLLQRHQPRGIRAFSPRAFALQFETPGFHVLRASHDGEAVAAMTFVLQDEVVHGHVQGSSPLGYSLGAQYALIASAIDRFRGVARWFNLMGVPGGSDRGAEGIRDFKLGWTSVTRPSYLCGRILDRARYAALADATGAQSSQYFPAYRHDELV